MRERILIVMMLFGVKFCCCLLILGIHCCCLTNHFSSTDIYDTFFIGGGSPDSYLNLLNHTIFNETFYNGTTNASNSAIDPNVGNSDEKPWHLVLMTFLSIILGILILITVIGMCVYVYDNRYIIILNITFNIVVYM